MTTPEVRYHALLHVLIRSYLPASRPLTEEPHHFTMQGPRVTWPQASLFPRAVGRHGYTP